MKRATRLSIAILLSFLVFVSSVGGTLASWASQGDTVNKLTLGEVRGQILEEYRQGQTVMPGDTVQKKVNIKNTGTVDSLVRVRLEKQWGSARDENGKLIPDSALRADAIHVTCNSSLWQFDASDGYWYYRSVLSPNETTAQALMDSFTIDAGLGNDYAGKTADIAVKLECVQAGGNGISYWGKTLGELGITYASPQKKVPQLSASFVSPDRGFRFDAADGDLFQNFKELIPGETRSEILEVGSESTGKTEIFLHAALYNRDISAGERDKAERFLRDYAVLTIADETGKVLYSGPVWDAENGADSMKNKLSLGVYPLGSSRKFTVSLSVSPEADNTFASLLGEVKWIFEASGKATPVPDGPSDTPYTGDSFNLLFFASVAVVSGSLLLFLTVKKKRRERQIEFTL